MTFQLDTSSVKGPSDAGLPPSLDGGAGQPLPKELFQVFGFDLLGHGRGGLAEGGGEFTHPAAEHGMGQPGARADAGGVGEKKRGAWSVKRSELMVEAGEEGALA